MTLHDYKVVCPAYTLFTEGAPCRRCVGARRCMSSAHGASRALRSPEHAGRRRGDWPRPGHVREDRCVHLAEPVPRRTRRATEIPAERVHVIPNFLPVASGRGRRPRRAARDPYALYAGPPRRGEGRRDRCSRRSAPARQIAAAARVAGDGPLRGLWSAAASSSSRATNSSAGSRDEEVDASAARAERRGDPVLWEENCPMIVLEARAVGTPVVGASSGGLPELVDHGATAARRCARPPRHRIGSPVAHRRRPAAGTDGRQRARTVRTRASTRATPRPAHVGLRKRDKV